MELKAGNHIVLKPIDKENAKQLFPLFKADLKELSLWFPFGEDYQVAYDLAYIDEKNPPYDETYIIFYNGVPCGRVGLYDYDEKEKELFLYYWVASPYRRKHIALHAVTTVLDFLKSLGMRRVLLEVSKDNGNSIKLITKLNGQIVNEENRNIIYACSLLPFKTFGEKENDKYYDREGAYVVLIKNNMAGVVRTPKGCFLIGGGMEEGKTERDCLHRECLEETGYTLTVKEKIASAETYCRHPKVNYFHPIQHYYIGELSEKTQEPLEGDHFLEWISLKDISGKLFAPMQEWAIETAVNVINKA